jgi:hypothetical protein
MLAIRLTSRHCMIATIFCLCIAVTTAMAEQSSRWSISTQQTRAERDAGVTGKPSHEEHVALVIAGSRASGKHSPRASEVTVHSGATNGENFWFYSADVLLFNDHDADGHYHGVDLLFDADTNYGAAEVYAVAYLSLADGPWNEYFVSDDFTLYGTSADDEFNIVTELVSGYPTGSYDLLIELFDAYNGHFLASFGPIDTAALAFLPLEDSNLDVPQESTTVVVVEDGGGSLGWLTLLVLLGVRRFAARRSPES